MEIKHLKIIALIIAIFFAIIVLSIGVYAIWMESRYYRIADNIPLTISNSNLPILQTGKKYTALTYNLGFGAYNQDFSFFLDKGTMLDGTPVEGKFSRGQSFDIVRDNTLSSMTTVMSKNPDFCLLQEVDSFATRSYHIDQKESYECMFPEYAAVYALNLHTPFLLYPLFEPHGRAYSGLLTLSRYAITEATRKSYPVDQNFIEKFVDLDRCFVLLRLPVDNGKELVLINSHLSAYDKGGKMRAKQLAMLNEVMSVEREKGNYVIVGGDFNHTLFDTKNTFATQQQVPDWVFTLSNHDLVPGFQLVKANNATTVPTCRSCDLPYVKGINYTSVLDGFIVSDNIKASACNLDTEFKNSDHNPVLLTFLLE
ncbi:MAG: endonuclease/exonuclease/phosphatase family protein [Bacteroidales bacterium]